VASRTSATISCCCLRLSKETTSHHFMLLPEALEGNNKPPFHVVACGSRRKQQATISCCCLRFSKETTSHHFMLLPEALEGNNIKKCPLVQAKHSTISTKYTVIRFVKARQNLLHFLFHQL
jgi:hypothetical protein